MTAPAIEEIDFSDVDAAIAALRSHVGMRSDVEMYAAADFVAAQGTLGDLFDDDELTTAQVLEDADAIWNLIAHWSLQRGDGLLHRPETFEAHKYECETCAWLEDVLDLVVRLRQKPCAVCAKGVDEHMFAPAPTWVDGELQISDWFQAFAWCKEPWTRYLEPLVEPPGKLGAYQVSDACTARWTAPLINGSHALLYRTYYLTRVEDAVFLEREDWYVVCLNPADPEGTKVMENSRTEEVESEDPEGEDLLALVEQSFDPEFDEWLRFMPQSSAFYYAR